MSEDPSRILKSSKKLEHSRLQDCPLCPKVFRTLKHLPKHIQSHTKEKPFKCDYCSFRTSCQRNMKCHTGTKHEDQLAWENRPKFRCELCTFKAYQSSALEIHLSKHSGERNFPCKFAQCSHRSRSRGDLKKHCIRAHCDDRPFSCAVEGCAYTGKTITDVRRHAMKHGNYRPFPCPHEGCDYKAKVKRALSAHLNFMHGKELYKCSFPGCTFQTRSPPWLKRHSTVHVESFGCSFPKCVYRGRTKDSLRSHHRVRHEKIKPYTCPFPQCNFGAAVESRLKEHMERHCEDRPFPCTLGGCEFRAKTKSDLERHRETHNKEPKFPCPNLGCTYVARQKRALRVHVNDHGNYPDFRPCPESGCNHWLRDSNSFLKHQRIHNSQRRFPCPFCPKFFLNRYYLQLHTFSHTGEKPYKCVHCDHGCYDKKSLMGHYTRNHQAQRFRWGWLKPTVVCKYCSLCGTPDDILRHMACRHTELVVSLQRIRIEVL